MQRITVLGLLFLFPLLAIAQEGKLRGRVIDRESGEPLIGATVAVEGTTLGAATDINGEYIVLNIPTGVYTVRATFVGYAPYVISNVRLSSEMTTTQDFPLSSDAVQVDAVEIIAERPLIQRNTTNTVRLTTQEDIANLPVRGVENILSLQAGVVQQNNELFVRGGREGEIAYFVDGANTTNPITSTQTVGVIQEAIEEFQLQAGGYTAEFGGANSGIVRTTLRSGTPTYKGSLDLQTDDFAKPGKSFLGSSSFGYRNFVGTLSGPFPAINNFKFFLAGQHNYLRNRDQRYITPFRFDSLVTDVNDARGEGVPLPGPIAFGENYIPGNSKETNTIQGTLSYDLQPFKFRFSGSYQADEQPFDAEWPRALENYFNQRRGRIDKSKVAFGNLRFSHILNQTTFYEVGVSMQNRNFKRVDPDFGDSWLQYTDSVANARIGYNFDRPEGYSSERRFAPPPAYSTINAFEFDHPNTPNNTYQKNNQASLGLTGDITSQLNKHWEIKGGAEYNSWETRHYNVGNIQSAMEFLYGENGKSIRTFPNQNDRRVRLAKAGVINHYGYDVMGNPVESGLDGPRKPLFASAYVQNKYEYQDLIINFGLRYEYFDTKNKTFSDPLNPSFDPNLDVIDESKLVEQDAFSFVLPRISFSFPVTAATVFFAQYGKYAQMPSLENLYVGNTLLSRTVSIFTRGNAFLTPVGFLMVPERSTHYEMGIRQSLSDNFAVTFNGFYKDYRDQLQVRSFVNATGNKLFTAFLNEDFETSKGIELTLELRRVNRLAAKLNYTLSDARGTGSNPRSAFGAVEQNIGRPTNFINPVDHNQTHRGSMLFDYQIPPNEGGVILGGVGANMILNFNSGHNFTRIQAPSELGQSNSWNVGVEPLNDPRSSFPVEPLNASTTPWVFNIDLRVSKMFKISNVGTEIYVNVLNLLNSKNVLNVYPTTGTAQDDGWLGSPFAASFSEIPNYTEFYNAINLQNRWAYMNATGDELFGNPRQVRLGIKFEI